MDLWTTQRSVAHKLHNANSSSKRKRTNDVLSKPDKSECYRHRRIGGRANTETLPRPDRRSHAAGGTRGVDSRANCIMDHRANRSLETALNEGLTAAAIAARLGGLSRSAVLGKVHRLRLRTDKATAASAVKAKSAGERCATTPARRRRGGKRGKHPQAAPAAVSQHKTLFELTNKTCRWGIVRKQQLSWQLPLRPGRTCTERHDVPRQQRIRSGKNRSAAVSDNGCRRRPKPSRKPPAIRK